MSKPGKEQDSAIYAAFRENRVALKRFIARFLGIEADIDDVSQEAFLKAFNAEREKSIVNPKAFLFRIAKNLALRELTKKSHRITDLVEDFDGLDVIGSDGRVNDVENETLAREDLGIFCQAVATLPEQCRRVFLMRKVYGLSHREIAGRLDISVSTVEKHLVKGLRLCSRYMREEVGETATARSLDPRGRGTTSSVRQKS